MPFAKGLTNCSATGATHPALDQAGKLQFRTPDVDTRADEVMQEFEHVSEALKRVMAKIKSVNQGKNSA